MFHCDTFSGLIYFTVESDSDNHPWFLSFFATSMRNPTEPHCFQLNLSASNLDFTVSDISRRKSATGEPEILYCYGILNMFWSWGFCSLHELADHTITMDHLRAYPLIDFDTTLNTIIRCLHFYGLLKYICKLMKYWGLGFFWIQCNNCLQSISGSKYYLAANTLTVQLVRRTRQRSGSLSQPGFESRHTLLKMKIRRTSLPLVEFF